jgi:hypothetical protein
VKLGVSLDYDPAVAEQLSGENAPLCVSGRSLSLDGPGASFAIYRIDER